MRTTTVSRWMLVGIGMLTAASMAACSANPAASTGGPSNTRTATPVASVAATPTAAVATSPPSGGAPGATPTTPGGIQNLVVTNSVLSELTTDYVKTINNIDNPGISPSDVTQPLAGSVYYASGPATGVYWAIAEFAPSPTASQAAKADINSSGAHLLWQRFGPTPYAWIAETGPGPRPLVCEQIQFFPSSVLEAWGLPTSAPASVNCSSG